MQLLASQLSVKYTSEPRETEWIAAILLALPQSRLLKVAIEIPLRSPESYASLRESNYGRVYPVSLLNRCCIVLLIVRFVLGFFRFKKKRSDLFV